MSSIICTEESCCFHLHYLFSYLLFHLHWADKDRERSYKLTDPVVPFDPVCVNVRLCVCKNVNVFVCICNYLCVYVHVYVCKNVTTVCQCVKSVIK